MFIGDYMKDLQLHISVLFEKISGGITDDDKDVVDQVVRMLDSGKIRSAEKIDGKWRAVDFVKKAILLYMRHSKSCRMGANFSSDFSRDNTVVSAFQYYDKVPLKFSHFTDIDFEEAGFRVVPGSVVRMGAFIGKKVVLMPSFINIGAYVDEGTMIDTWATIGSCAQIGKNCHISGGVGIGGVLEPISEVPVIIEDNVFIGARSEIAEGVIVEEGSVISMGVYIGASTKIVNRESGEIFYGRVPAGSVVVPGTYPSKGANLYAAIIVKTVDAKTRSKVSINELLRV